MKECLAFHSQYITIKLMSLKMLFWMSVSSSSQYLYIDHLIPHLHGRNAVFISHLKAKEAELSRCWQFV